MKIKIKSLLCIAIFCIGLISCHDLDLEPKGLLGESEIFGSQSGVLMYFTGLYGYLPIEDFHYMVNSGAQDGYRPNAGWDTWNAQQQSLQNVAGEFVSGHRQWTDNDKAYWPYDRIREINTFIEGFPKFKDKFEEDEYQNFLGEARFLRAFFYSGMAKRYGGVPIITEVQDPLGDAETLQVSRSTEYDTWKFIWDDLKYAMDNMTDKKNVTRASKYTAAALASRMMLYAGTNAKYSQYLGFENEAAYQQGLAGMTADKANEFFQYSYDAGKLVESGGYTLYTAGYPDKIANFVNLFLDQNSSENIFIKKYGQREEVPYNTQLLPHSWDTWMCPYPDMAGFIGAVCFPALDMMRMYDFPDIVDTNGYPIRFDNRGDIREGMEPRLRASMYFSGDELRGSTFDIQRGLYETFTWKAEDVVIGNADDVPNLNGNRIISNQTNREEMYKGIRILTKHGMINNGRNEGNNLTGAFVRKYVDYNLPLSMSVEHRSIQPWIVFRLGEIYLNMAEVCWELGKKEEAAGYIRAIRERAGCKNIELSSDLKDVSWEYERTSAAYPIDVELQFIRDERYRELWGENHRYFDLRRWRTADRILDRWIPRILACYYVIDENKFIYLDERELSSRTWTASKTCYYQGIPQSQIDRNPKLLPQNPLR
jgi:hypothetical protein